MPRCLIFAPWPTPGQRHWDTLVALLLGIAALPSALPSALIQAGYARKLYLWQRSCTRKERADWYRHWLLTSDGYAKEIRLFNSTWDRYSCASTETFARWCERNAWPLSSRDPPWILCLRPLP